MVGNDFFENGKTPVRVMKTTNKRAFGQVSTFRKHNSPSFVLLLLPPPDLFTLLGWGQL